ncbi:MAG: hypothetical protein IPH84_08545 [Bacteroidales bacterium]|nr:hypothetical protein [Bacteroidales bacterium]
MSDCGCRMWDVGCGMSDVECGLHVGCGLIRMWMSDVECWMWNVGCGFHVEFDVGLDVD